MLDDVVRSKSLRVVAAPDLGDVVVDRLTRRRRKRLLRRGRWPRHDVIACPERGIHVGRLDREIGVFLVGHDRWECPDEELAISMDEQ